jgi:hypothetical protein
MMSGHPPLPVQAPAELAPKRPRGGQPANVNARKHGAYTMKRALQELGERAIDGRTRLGKALADWRTAMLADLGGQEDLSAMEFEALGVLQARKVILESVAGYLLEQTASAIADRLVHKGLLVRITGKSRRSDQEVT